MSAYIDDRPFSIDLVAAVSHQCSFVNKIYQHEWTVPGYFDDEHNKAALINARTRYHKCAR